MNKKNKRPSAPSAINRLNVLEAKHNILVAQLQKNLQSMSNRLQNIERVLAAVTEIVGAEEVNTKVTEQVHAEQEERADNNEAAVNKAVEEGRLVETDVADADDVIIVSQEKNEKGDVMYPTRIILPLGAYNNQPEVKELLSNKKPGDAVEMPNKHVVTVLRCYKPVPPPEEQVEVATGNPVAEPAPEPQPEA